MKTPIANHRLPTTQRVRTVAVRIADSDVDADVRAVLAALSIDPVDSERDHADLLLSDNANPADHSGPAGAPSGKTIRVCSDATETTDPSMLRLPSQLAQLVDELERPVSRSGRAVACVGAVGGCGTTTTAMLLALRLDAMLVDADPLGAGIDLVLGVENSPGLRLDEIRTTLGGLDPHHVSSSVPTTARGVAVLSRQREQPRMNRDTLATTTRQVVVAQRSTGSAVIIDAGRVDVHDQVASCADHLVVVTRADVTGAMAARRLIHAYQLPATLVVAPVRHGGLDIADIAEASGCVHWHQLPFDRHLARMCSSGELAHRLPYRRGRSGRRLVQLVDHIVAEAGIDVC